MTGREQIGELRDGRIYLDSMRRAKDYPAPHRTIFRPNKASMAPVVVLFFVLPLSGCIATTSKVTVVVSDSESGAPVPEANVILQRGGYFLKIPTRNLSHQEVGTTNGEGKWQFLVYDNTVNSIYVSKQGYIDRGVGVPEQSMVDGPLEVSLVKLK